MIFGTVTLEDTEISFWVLDDGTNKVEYTIIDCPSGEREDFIVSQDKFFKALAIAVHNDGMPDYKKDYLDAESIQGKIRWIP